MSVRSATPGRRGHATSCALLAAAALVAGCGLPKGETLLRPSDVSNAVQSSLYVHLIRLPDLKWSPAFPDVQARYVADTTNERLLILVFRSSEATVQVLGRRSPRIPGLVALPYRNVVVLYEHTPGTLSRTPELRSALRAIRPRS